MDDLLDILSRRRWYLLIPFLVIVLGGLVLARTLPKIYQARALIMVRTPAAAGSPAGSPPAADIYLYTAAISQQVLSRANLEKTLQRFRLLDDDRHRQLSMEEKTDLLRRRITIEAIQKDNRLLNVVQIAFKDPSPGLAMQVANAFARLVVAENIGARPRNAAGTTSFLADEQAAVKQKLEHYEKALQAYRQRYMGGLPEQLDANLRALDRLQGQLMARREDLNEARFRLASVESLIADRKKGGPKQPRPAAAAPAPTGENGQSLAELRARLAELQTRYTEKHPDIVRLKMAIARLQRTRAPAAGKKRAASATAGGTDPELASYLVQRTEIKNRIQSLTEEIARLQRQIDRRQKLVEDTPRRQQELQALQRSYDEARETYRALLEKKLDADMAVSLRPKEPRRRFVVIDPATLPRMPAEPDLQRLFALTLALALAVGGGLVFIREYTDTSFRKSREVEPFLGVPVLTEVPLLNRPANRRRKTIRQGLTVVCILLCAIFVGGFAALTF